MGLTGLTGLKGLMGIWVGIWMGYGTDDLMMMDGWDLVGRYTAGS